MQPYLAQALNLSDFVPSHIAWHGGPVPRPLTSRIQQENWPNILPVLTPLSPWYDLPFDAHTFLISFFFSHYTSHLPLYAHGIKQALHPNKQALILTWLSPSLHHMKHCLTHAELTLKGEASPRFLPLKSLPQVVQGLEDGGLKVISAAPFSLKIHSPHIGDMAHILRRLGEGNTLKHRYTLDFSVFRHAQSLWQKEDTLHFGIFTVQHTP